jgi:RimJ/RimL family protein N-acetyltransferase
MTPDDRAPGSASSPPAVPAPSALHPQALHPPVLTGTLPDGSTLTLRPHRDTDRDAIMARCLDPEVLRWTTIPSPYTEEMLDEYLDSLAPNPSAVSWALEVDGDYAGTIDLRIGHRGSTAGEPGPGTGTGNGWGGGLGTGTAQRLPFGPRSTAEVGFVTGPHARGRGAMTEALRLVLDHGFAQGLATIGWQAHVPNLGSAKIAWRNGYRLQFVEARLVGPRVGVVDSWWGVLSAEDPREPFGDWDTEVLPRLRAEAECARFPG